jgi:hypothetical protein
VWPFAQQPIIRIEDQFGNLRGTDSATLVTATRNAGSGTLQGTTNLGAINGVVSFTNLSHNLVTNITINFAATGLPIVTSSNVLINAGAFSKLQLLAPGESAAPGTPSGKTGTPSAQTAGHGLQCHCQCGRCELEQNHQCHGYDHTFI